METMSMFATKRDLLQAKAKRLLKELDFGPIPSWATHIAVSHVRDCVEPCAYIDEAGEYIDEDPKECQGEWSSCYKKSYWDFFSVDLLMSEETK